MPEESFGTVREDHEHHIEATAAIEDYLSQDTTSSQPAPAAEDENVIARTHLETCAKTSATGKSFHTAEETANDAVKYRTECDRHRPKRFLSSDCISGEAPTPTYPCATDYKCCKAPTVESWSRNRRI